MALPRGYPLSWSKPWPTAARPAPARKSKTISAFPPASPGQALSGRAFVQACRNSAPPCMSPPRGAPELRPAPLRRRAWPMAAWCVGTASSYRHWRAVPQAGPGQSRPLRQCRHLPCRHRARSAPVQGRGGGSRRRRQFRRPGRHLFVQRLPPRPYHGAFRRPGGKHVALPDPAHRDQPADHPARPHPARPSWRATTACSASAIAIARAARCRRATLATCS